MDTQYFFRPSYFRKSIASDNFDIFSGDGQWNPIRQGLDAILEMRLLGLVKKNGAVQNIEGQFVEYPFYNDWSGTQPTFVEGTPPNSFGPQIPEYKYLFTYGNYTINSEGKGVYRLMNGYILGDDGYIYYRGGDTTGTNITTDGAVNFPSTDDKDKAADQPDADENTDEAQDTEEDDSKNEETVSGNAADDVEFEHTSKVEVGTEEVTVDSETMESGEPVQEQDENPVVDDTPAAESDSMSVPTPADDYANLYSYYLNQFLPATDSDRKIESDWSLDFYRGGGDYLPLPEGVEYCGDTADGNLDFVPADAGFYWGYSQTKTYVNTNNNAYFKNSDWFKAYVLGDKNSKVKVEIVTKAAKSVTIEDVTNANLVYISGRAEAFAGNGGISEAVLQTLYEQSVVGVGKLHKAIMMDYLAYSGNTVTESSNTIDKLAILLWQEDQKKAPSSNANYTSYFNESGAIDKVNDLLKDTSFLSDLQSSMIDVASKNFVTGNLYVYHHSRDLFNEPRAMVDCWDCFQNGDFASIYTEAVCASSFANVRAYIENNNELHEDYIVPVNDITPALIIQYILSADGSASSFVKSSINVLEIEPTGAFKFNSSNMESDQYIYANDIVKENRKEFIEKYINPDWVSEDSTSGREGFVNFDSMTVNEFVCRNQNIIETYDIVYIGSEVSSAASTGDKNNPLTFLHTQKCDELSWDYVNSQKQTIDITRFNDKTMSGMVYFNIGDTAKLNTINGNDTGRYLTGERYSLDAQGNIKLDQNGNPIALAKTIKREVRYAGADLNTEKLNQLKQYLMAGHPIIVAGDLMCSDSTGMTYCVNPTRYIYTDSASPIVTVDGADRGRIDNASNMYELFQFALHHVFDHEKGYYVQENGNGTKLKDSRMSSYKYANFISERDVSRGKVSWETINTYLNTPKLYLDIVSMPTEYTYQLMTVNDKSVINPDTTSCLERDADGEAYLDYEFSVSGITASNANNKYNIKLFVDVNSDGKFASDEECDDSVVTLAATSEEVERDENGEYILEEGTAYRLRRPVPESYVGIIPWCLRAQLSTDENIQTNEKGFTRIKAKDGQKVQIRILQIDKENKNNLQNDIKNNNGSFGPYLNKLDDYDVKVITKSVDGYKTDFVSKNGKADPMAYFENYDFSTVYPGAGKGVDMLLLGFGDSYPQIGDEDALKAIKLFMDSGKPVLLTHDFLIYHNRSQEDLLRNSVGMDKYGVTVGEYSQLRRGVGSGSYPWSDPAQDKTNMTAGQEAESLGRAVAYIPDSERSMLSQATQGFNNCSILRGADNNGNNYYGYAEYLCAYWKDKTWKNTGFMVDQLNDGQLTEYPYHISKTFEVSQTHAQYLQLDMESDFDSDGSTDMTVWYTLSYRTNTENKRISLNGISDTTNGSMYQVTPGDGINNYYIYNQGNITYSGAGDTKITKDEEIKLFVNTLISAYSAAEQAPTVKFYETSSSTSNELSSIAIPYDSIVNKKVINDDGDLSDPDVDSSIEYDKDRNEYEYKFVDPNVDTNVAAEDKTAVFFKATDSNFKKGTKRMSLTFYLEVFNSEIITNATTGDRYIKYGTENKSVITKTVDGVERNVIELDIQVFETDMTTVVQNHKDILNENNVSTTKSDIQSGKMYGFYLPLKYLNDRGTLPIYVEAQTFVENKATSGMVVSTVNPYLGYGRLDVTKVDLMKLD